MIGLVVAYLCEMLLIILAAGPLVVNLEHRRGAKDTLPWLCVLAMIGAIPYVALYYLMSGGRP